MGENNLKPIVGKSHVLEEKRLRDKRIKQIKRMAALARRRRQRRRAIAKLVMFMCIITLGLAAILYMVSNISDKNEEESKNTAEQNDGPTDAAVLEQLDVLALNIGASDYIYDCKDADVLNKLREKAKDNITIKFVYENYKAYPENLLKALANNSELADFAAKYPVEIKKKHDGVPSVQDMYTEGEMPLFIQWDDRWAYYPYGDDVIGTTGCGPTCLSMVMVALTGKTQYTPTSMANFAMDNGYYYKGGGTTWDLFNKGPEKLGLTCSTVILNEASMKAALDNGEYLVLNMGPGIFTTVGHYIVVYGYNSDGEFLVKDPNSRIRSKTSYSYEAIETQIKNIWAIGI